MDSDSPEPAGRTMPARSPIVQPSPASTTIAAVETSTDRAVSAAPELRDDQVDSVPTPTAQAPPICHPSPGPRLTAVPIDAASEEEQVLLSVLRLLDRVLSPGTLSPVERAFIAGAKVTFDQLSKECERMLRRKASDLVGSAADPTREPESAGTNRPSPPRKKPARRVGKSTKAGS